MTKEPEITFPIDEDSLIDAARAQEAFAALRDWNKWLSERPGQLLYREKPARRATTE